ncbi:hypothetical protein N7507_008020 [Penicillium longicatenatum]|nr:hypothetical protein N7507_008020 [Penicillium longicatenatum]
MADINPQTLDDILLDTFDNLVSLQEKVRDSRARLSISMAKDEAHSKPKSDDSDDIVDSVSGNLPDHDRDHDSDSDSGDESEDDYANKDNDHKILLNGDKIPWKISIYPPPYRNLKRLVAWQIERHIQWTDDEDRDDHVNFSDCPFKDKKFFYSAFHMRTAKDLKKGKPFKDGNLGIVLARTCFYHGTMGEDSDEKLSLYPWGQPAAALGIAARSHCNNPEDWILLDEPRKLLIAMEEWYFEQDEPKRKSLAESAWYWIEIQAAEPGKWNQAFSVCGCGKGKRCRMSRGESEKTD